MSSVDTQDKIGCLQCGVLNVQSSECSQLWRLKFCFFVGSVYMQLNVLQMFGRVEFVPRCILAVKNSLKLLTRHLLLGMFSDQIGSGQVMGQKPEPSSVSGPVICR